MALFPPLNSVMAATNLVPSSQLKHQKNNLQHELIHYEEESLKDLYGRKSRSYSHFLSAEKSQYSSGHGGIFSAGLQSKHLTSQTKTLPAKSVARRKEGVDRAYPLKPIFHQNGVSVPVVNTAQLGSSPYVEEAPNSRPSSMSKGKPLAGRSQLAAGLSPWTTEPKLSASYLHRRELAYILKLEAEGQTLEEEIRKKETLIREKLRRTKEELRRIQREEELRRIQREEELVEAEERRDREVERTPERKVARHPEEKTLRVAVRPGDGVFGGAQSAEVTIHKPGTTLHPQELAMGKLKKEHLVASNSKIQDYISMECLASCSVLAPKHSPSPSALSDQDSGDHPLTEVLYTQADSAVGQGGLGECSFCGRKFLCTRLKKHMSICSKSQGSKRKVFDSRKARAMGTDLEKYQQWKSSERPQNKPPRRNTWRQKHEAFIQTLHEAQQVQQQLSTGGKVSDLPPLPPIKNTEDVACPYCRRRFAPQAAERHIPKCKTIKNRPPPPLQRKCC
ncbi:zinc finger C2HC domain-containing protein 1C [Athene cunicularia]|uniref:Zinc finger C2HC-type containing 1C n=1 Tax=Athene cunicularia TaxID=194338 RepID=A0A663MCG2_ATHCN|nr:zinc finger C2HC domain-containing protein 1C [Athene cunicularia]